MNAWITDDIGTVVEGMREKFITADFAKIYADSILITADGGGAPFYMYDTRRGISNALKAKDKSSASLKYQKYPLVALKLPTPELVDGGFVHYKLNIGLFAFTKKSYTTAQRMDEVIKPFLGRLYEMFFESMRDSGLFFWPNYQEMPKHTRVIRPYWGTEGAEGTESNPFPDPLDAIEIIDLEVNSKFRC